MVDNRSMWYLFVVKILLARKTRSSKVAVRSKWSSMARWWPFEASEMEDSKMDCRFVMFCRFPMFSRFCTSTLAAVFLRCLIWCVYLATTCIRRSSCGILPKGRQSIRPFARKIARAPGGLDFLLNQWSNWGNSNPTYFGRWELLHPRKKEKTVAGIGGAMSGLNMTSQWVGNQPVHRALCHMFIAIATFSRNYQGLVSHLCELLG